MIAELPRLLSRYEAAHLLGISPRTLKRQQLRGRLACVRIGRRILFDVGDLIRFVAAQRRE